MRTMTLSPLFAPPLPKGVEMLGELVPRPAVVNKNRLAGTPGIFTGRKSTFDPKNPGKSQRDQWTTWQRLNADKGLAVWAFANEGTVSASRFGTRNKYREVMEWIAYHVKAGNVAWLGWYSIDRATRDAEFGIQFLKLLREHNVMLVIDEDVYDPSNPDDEKRVLDMITTAQHMAAKSRKNTLRGIAESAEEGKPHGPECYGYERVYDKSHQLIDVRIVAEEEEVLREIATRTLDDLHSANSIANDLTRRGLRRRRGGIWRGQDVTDTLLCPSYRGLRKHRVEETGAVEYKPAMWPAIYDEALAARIDRHFAIKPKMVTVTKAKYLLTGVAVCPNPRCDGANRMERKAFYRKDKRIPPAYVCETCYRQRNAADLELHVRHVVDEWLTDDRFIEQMTVDETDPALDAAELEAEKIVEDMKPYADGSAVALYDMDPAMAAATHKAYKARLAKLNARITQMKAALPHNGWAEARKAGLRSLPEDTDIARQWLRDLVVVEVHPSGVRGRVFDDTTIIVVPLR